MTPAAISGLTARMQASEARYGPFASTHEALGVCMEEWHELVEAVRSNNPAAIRHEVLDLAAALVRLHDGLEADSAMFQRSIK